MTPYHKIPLFAACLFFLVSCSKEQVETGGTLLTREIRLTRLAEDDVRSTYNEVTGELYWNNGDIVHTYTFNDTSGTVPAPVPYTVVRESNYDAVVKLAYDAGHDCAVFISKGSKVGDISANDRQYVTITGGIPAVQDGKLESSFVNISDKLILQSQDRMGLESQQAFLAFSMDSTVLGGKAVKEVTIQGGLGTEPLAGDVRYDLTGAEEAALVGNEKTEITFEDALAFEKLKRYYVAMKPGTYAKGLKFIVKDADGVTVAWIKTPEISITAGKVTYIGNLCGHKTVPARADCLVMHPADIHIANLPEYCLTKKLYVDYFPLDMDGVTWESDDNTVATVAAGPDEYYNGHWCKTATVTPVWSSTDPKAEATCTITCKDIYSEVKCTCSVTVGWAVDMGFSNVYFLATNVKGSNSGGTLTLESAPGIGSDYYHWGFVDKTPRNGHNWSTAINNVSAYDQARGWTGTDKGAFYLTPGSGYNKKLSRNSGKYSTATGKQVGVLDASDDPCEIINPGKWRMAMRTEAKEFRDNIVQKNGIVFNGTICRKVTSTVKYYEDVYLVFPLNGMMMINSDVNCVGSDACILLKECNTAGMNGHHLHAQGSTLCYADPYTVGFCLFDDYAIGVPGDGNGHLFRLESGPIRGVQPK